MLDSSNGSRTARLESDPPGFPDPLFALLLVVIATYATLGYVTIAGVSLFQVLTLILGFCVGVRILLGAPVDRRVVVRLVAPFSIFFAICILSTSLAVSLPSSANYLRNWAGSLLLAFVVAHLIRRTRQLEQLLIWTLVVTLLGAALAILQRYVSATFSLVPFFADSSDPYAYYFSRGGVIARPAGFSKMNFELGKDMLAGVMPALALLLVGRRHLGLAGVVLSVGGFAIAISGLRSAWLAAAAGSLAIFILWLQAVSDQRRAARAAAAAVASLVVISVSLFAAMRASADRAYSTNLRIALAHASVAMLEDSPLLGVGIGNFKYRFAEYYPEGLQLAEIDPRRDVPTHNVPLEVLVGAGPVALLAYLLVQLAAVANCVEAAGIYRARRGSAILGAAAVGICGTLVALFVEYLMHNHMFENHLWVFVGASFAVRRLAQTQR